MKCFFLAALLIGSISATASAAKLTIVHVAVETLFRAALKKLGFEQSEVNIFQMGSTPGDVSAYGWKA